MGDLGLVDHGGGGGVIHGGSSVVDRGGLVDWGRGGLVGGSWGRLVSGSGLVGGRVVLGVLSLTLVLDIGDISVLWIMFILTK